jgi:hypothetical protein
MENLREKVYECTLAVEAHMVCDLLARAGISARVEGEFLSGAGGELPLGSTISVRVDAARAAEAREVIDEWEREQPPVTPAASSPPARSWLRSPLWFFAGVVVGAFALYFASRSPVTSASADYDGDGIEDQIYHYAGVTLDRVDEDRNGDGKIDARWFNDLQGVAKRYEGDDNFDGRFEWRGDAQRGLLVTSTLDSNGDGNTDAVMHMSHGVLRSVDVYDEAGERVVARHLFVDGFWNESTEFDADGDGVFERRVEYDRYGEPKPR